MIGRASLSGVLQEIGVNDIGENFVRILSEDRDIIISGLTDDEVRALAPRFASLVGVEIGAAK